MYMYICDKHAKSELYISINGAETTDLQAMTFLAYYCSLKFTNIYMYIMTFRGRAGRKEERERMPMYMSM